MPSRFTQRIIDHLAYDQYKPSEVGDIRAQMRVSDDDEEAFEASVNGLVAEGRAELGKDEKLRLPKYGDEAEGIIKINQRGFGFLVPASPTREGDLFIPAGQTRDALHGDRVRCKVFRKSESGVGRGAFGGGAGGGGPGPGGRSGATGRVVEVLERRQSAFSGTLVKEGREFHAIPDGRGLREPVVIRDPHAKNAKVGDKVVFELVRYPTEYDLAEGVITQVLGPAGRPDVETQAVICSFNIREGFSDEMVAEAREAALQFEREKDGPWPDRQDLTQDVIFTIDPPDARDFDDAISIRHDAARNEWELGVHIADVAHFVKQDGPMDTEARERGNSVYLPRHVVPMLPEVLSNGVCSLQEGVPRFCKSVFITFDSRGRPASHRLANTVIKSRKRLTYIEAQAVIDGDLNKAREHARTDTGYEPEVVEALALSNKLARILRERRRDDGMITLALPEVELTFDEAGHVTGVKPEDDSFTHTLIEMFMVEANEALARTFSGLDIPLLRRIHPEPTWGDLEELRAFARAAKYRVGEEPTRRDLQALLDATRESESARAIHFAVLRTLSKATYSPALVGHYALASEHYAHFTSPIRRYPDLTVHRVLGAYLDATDNGRNPGGRKRRQIGESLRADSRVLDEPTLVKVGLHCSDTEVTAEGAERDLRTFLVLQYLHDHRMSDTFDALVTGISGSQLIFLSIEHYLVDGVARTGELPGAGGRAERWVHNEMTGRLSMPRSGASIGLGDRVKVAIAKIDLAARRMDLTVLKLQSRREEGDVTPKQLRELPKRKEQPSERRNRRGGAKNRHGNERNNFKKGRRGRKELVAVGSSRSGLHSEAPFEMPKKLRASMDADAWSRVLKQPSSILLYFIGLAAVIGASALLIEEFIPQYRRIGMGVCGSLGSIIIVVLLNVFKRRHFIDVLRENGFEVCIKCGYPLHRLPRHATNCPECGSERLRLYLEITRMHASAPDAQAIMAELDADLRARYPGYPIHSLQPGEEHSPLLIFYVMKCEGEWAACGALRLHTGRVGEVKRMFVRPQFRKRGFARAILARIEQQAQRELIKTLRLETGVAQPEALALYRSAGYTEIPKFGEYENDPHSVCFEKTLQPH